MTPVPYTKKYTVGFGKGLSTEQYKEVQFGDGWVTCYPEDTSDFAYIVYPAHAINYVKITTVEVTPELIRRSWSELSE